MTSPETEPPVDANWLAQEGEDAAKEPIVTPSVNVETYRETTRSQLARWLMVLLSVTVLTLLLLAGLQLAGIVGRSQISIRDLAQVTLTPVVTLTGTALGFYFGAQSAAGNGSAPEMPPPREPGALRRVVRRIW